MFNKEFQLTKISFSNPTFAIPNTMKYLYLDATRTTMVQGNSFEVVVAVNSSARLSFDLSGNDKQEYMQDSEE